MADKDKLEDIAGSGIPITIKGKEYKLGVLTIRDLADFRQYIRGKKIKLIQGTVEEPKERIELISKVLDSPIDETREMGTMDGVCFLLWKALEKRQKGLTLEEVDSLIDLENIGEISGVLMEIGGKIKNPPKGAKKG